MRRESGEQREGEFRGKGERQEIAKFKECVQGEMPRVGGNPGEASGVSCCIGKEGKTVATQKRRPCHAE